MPIEPTIHHALSSRACGRIALIVLAMLVSACGTLAPQHDTPADLPRPVASASVPDDLIDDADPSMPRAIDATADALPGLPASPQKPQGASPRVTPRTGVKRDGPGDRSVKSLLTLPDAQPRHEPLHPVANRPYSILGRSFVPDTARVATVQRGIASWYGEYFHGRRTSTGEVYDMYAMTAAHPTMALPSYARVTNTENGQSIVVRVNDRGPFVGQRIIDLSYAAAVRLGFATQGVAAVRVEPIRTAPGINDTIASATATAAATQGAQAATRGPARPNASSQPAPVSASSQMPAVAPRVKALANVFVKIGVFRQRANATRIGERVARVLPTLQKSLSVTTRSDGAYLVQAGPYPDRQEAIIVAENLRRELQLEPVVVVEP